MKKHNIFVFANLKPSQIFYKIIPLSQSSHVEKVIILRKKFIKLNQQNVICKSLPRFFRLRPFYWIIVPLYGIYLIWKYNVSLILNYNILPHGFNAYFASIITRRPVIFGEINEDTMKYYQNNLMKPLINSILVNANYITVTGFNNKKYWEKIGFSKLFQLHSTINTEYFLPSNGIKKCYDFVFIGEFDSNKRPDFILDAFSRINKNGMIATLCMIGFGNMLERLKEYIINNKLTKNVFLIKTNNVLDYLHLSKIFVMASVSEGIPCALLESMSCELIPIVPNIGDIADVVKHGKNGFIYDGSVDNLEKQMKETLIEYDNLTDIRTNARKTIVSEHSYQVASKKWDNLLSLIG